jgi:hypothetical protein
VATELTSTTITNILEAVPGIKTVLRSPAADAMVNLTRAAAGVLPFDIKDARELMRFAFRRGLINNEEHDKVLGDVEGATQARESRLAARRAAKDDRGHHGKTAKPKAAAHHGKVAHPAPHHPAKKVKPAARKPARAAARKAVRKPTAKKAKRVKKARPAAHAKSARPGKHK